VEAHLHHIYVKLGVRSRTELARHLVELERGDDGGGSRSERA
jgi:DNA-binding CsgD family transcriptional regulator